jgi:hypothetical protein
MYITLIPQEATKPFDAVMQKAARHDNAASLESILLKH